MTIADDAGSGGTRKALPWLLLLPPAALAWPGPGALLAGDPHPHLAGTGLAALAALPVVVALPWLGRGTAGRARGLLPLSLLWGLVAAGVLVDAPRDGFEARRMLVQASTWLVLFVGGALLEAPGRQLFNRALVVLSLAWTASALAGAALTRDPSALAGVLGNTGTLSQAALPGAAVGAWYVATRHGLFWALGLAAFACFVAHAGLAPVHAGSLSLLFVVLASSFLSPWARRSQVRSRMGMLAAVTAFSLVALGRLGAETPQEGATPAPADSTAVERAELGGVEVRARIWASLPAALADHPLFGLGPGQFQAGYPPYRDPIEIELSRGGVCSELDTDVEHAHQDYLHLVAELGLGGGALWLLFLALAARASLAALRARDFSFIAAGAGATSLLVNALFHSPLNANPAASSIAFVLLGTVLANAEPERGVVSRRAVAAASAVGLLGAVLAWPLVTHGRALASFVRAVEQDPAKAYEAARRALECAPRSAPARLVLARATPPPVEGGDGAADERLRAWEAVLAVRPNDVEALTNAGVRHALSGRPDAARDSWERALRLSPTHARLRRNLAELELRHGRTERGLALVDALRADGCDAEPGAPWSAGLGTELVLHGRWDGGAQLLLGSPLEVQLPEELFARADAPPPDAPPRWTKAMRALAHLLWSRQHVAAKNLPLAVKSMRHALTATRLGQPEGAPGARAEMAAVLSKAGRPAEAAGARAGLELDEGAWNALPAWAREALLADGFEGVSPGD